ncbi:hypothetical protein Q7C36_021442 [Tachysurus vachellii]|uniref:Uncharacterized protein n=1 Tax=Tachysurus vachellii TaxID=175792 RepID=A0AA88LQ64_TACVA|nr:hypothetical protein Q7C36_021442 [Tachysurus vachellii]
MTSLSRLSVASRRHRSLQNAAYSACRESRGEEVQRAPAYLIFDKEQHGQKSIATAQGERSWSEGASERTPDTLHPIPTQTSKEWTDSAFDNSRLLDARPNPAPPCTHDDQSGMWDTPFIRHPDAWSGKTVPETSAGR